MTFWKRQHRRDRNQISGCQILGWEERIAYRGHGGTPGWWWKHSRLQQWIHGCTYLSKLKTAHLRRVNVTVFKLYLNKSDFKNVQIPTSRSTWISLCNLDLFITYLLSLTSLSSFNLQNDFQPILPKLEKVNVFIYIASFVQPSHFRQPTFIEPCACKKSSLNIPMKYILLLLPL